MKRGVMIFLLIPLVLISYVFAQQDELNVRFYSFGKNATLDLKAYLGESELYLVSQTTNVIVEIDQEKGIATFTAKPGWEGSELIFFKTNESFKKVKGPEEIVKPPLPATLEIPSPKKVETNESFKKPPLPATLEVPSLKKVEYKGEIPILFEGIIDSSILDVIKGIKREEIRTLSKEMKGNVVTISVNDEVDLKLELGYVPTFSMDFSLGEKKEEAEKAKPEETGLRSKINNILPVIILSAITIIGIYVYRRYARIKEGKRKKRGLDYTLRHDIKRLSLNKLISLQKEPEKKESSDEFIKIVRDFFAGYFGVEHDFEFKHTIRRVKDSDIDEHMKNRITDFLNDLSKIVYHPTEEYSKAYGKGQISRQDLQKLIAKMKKIIQSI